MNKSDLELYGSSDKQNADDLKLSSTLPVDGMATDRIESDAKRIKRLEDGIKKFLIGDYPHPRTYKPKLCPHGICYWIDCNECDTEYLQGLLNNE